MDHSNKNAETLTNNLGEPVDNNEYSQTVGPRGPVLLQDFNYIDKMAKFDRERIPERVVHARGQGAHGFLEVTKDVTKFTKAKFLSKIGQKTQLFARLSTVVGPRGSSDILRDVRGFSLKFYTEDGIYDLVGNNTPVFFIRDSMKFPDLIHALKPDPVGNYFDLNAQWDFWGKNPESIHQVLILFSDRGVPYGYRHMHGYSSNTFKWVNDKDEAFFVKYVFKTDQGIKNFADVAAKDKIGEDDYFSSRDLYEHIEQGDFPSWTWHVQLIPESEGEKYRYDIYDITKVWPHKDFPLIEVGRVTLTKNPVNHFSETE